MSNARELAKAAASYGSGGFVGMKNRIINGDMRIDQRNLGAAVSNAGGYIVDRWGDAMAGNGRYTAQQVSAAPAGFSNSFQHTVTTAVSPAAGDIYQVFQFIEGLNMADLGFGTSAAQNITLSFWVRSSIAGTYGVSLKNGGGRTFLSTYTINSANTWEYKSVVITGDTGGTWSSINTAWGFLCFDLGSGSNANTSVVGSWQVGDYRRTSGCVNWIATSGATFNITGVQLEKGTQATGFEFRQYGTELALCQRYYYRISSVGNTYQSFGLASGYNATQMRLDTVFPVTMRAAPSSLDVSAASSFLYEKEAGYAASPSAIVLGSQSNAFVGVSIGTTSALTAGGAVYHTYSNGTPAYLGFSAEL